MQLPCTINGQPATVEIERETLLSIARAERGALSVTETAHYLGCCERTVQTHAALEKLHRTAYGTITMDSILAHLAEQTAKKKARKKKEAK